MSGNLLTDIGSIWAKYGSVYLDGIANTLILATTATLIGCIIGSAVSCRQSHTDPMTLSLKDLS